MMERGVMDSSTSYRCINLIIEGGQSYHMTSSKLYYFSKTLSPNTVILGTRMSTFEHSIHNRNPSSKFKTNPGPFHDVYPLSLWYTG